MVSSSAVSTVRPISRWPGGLIDLHLHLDGSISPASARQLAHLSGISLPVKEQELEKQLMCPVGCRDLNEYLSRFALPVSLMQTEEALETSALNLCRELSDEGHCYAEIRFAPQKHCQRGLSQREVIEAVLRGIKVSHLPAQLILCCMRQQDNASENHTTVLLTEEFLGRGVCTCDLAGAEALCPNEKFSSLFEEIRQRQLPCTIHAGEALGAESVASAIYFGEQRIGHGVRASEQEWVLELLAERHIPLEICPTSNLNTCVYKSVKEIPLPMIIAHGIPVTLNSDNRTVSHTSVRRELSLASEAFGWGKAELRQLLFNAADAAFLPEPEKENLRNIIRREWS